MRRSVICAVEIKPDAFGILVFRPRGLSLSSWPAVRAESPHRAWAELAVRIVFSCGVIGRTYDVIDADREAVVSLRVRIAR